MAKKKQLPIDLDLDLGSELATLLGGVEDKRLAPIINPHDFVFKYCYTLDPHDSTTPIKLMPNKEHLHRLVDIWMEEQLIVLGKSRQMQASWLFVALHLWDCIVHHGRVNFFVSRKEGDAGLDSPLSLLSRAWFIYERLPKDFKTSCRKCLQPPMLKFSKMDSAIQAMSQDSDALRTYTASAILCDEWAFQEKAEISYSAMKPTLDGGGKLTGISSPNGPHNLFYRLLHDQLSTKRRFHA